MKTLEQEQTRSVSVPRMMGVSAAGPKWRALRTLAFLLKILAWLGVASSAATAAFAIINGVPIKLQMKTVPLLSMLPAPLLSSLIVVIIAIGVGLLAFLLLFAMSEFILLLVMLEHHTRSHN